MNRTAAALEQVTAENIHADMILALESPDQQVRVLSVRRNYRNRIDVVAVDTCSALHIYLDDLNPTRYFSRIA